METLLKDMVLYVIGSLIHNSIYLLVGILVAAIMKVYIDPEKLKQVLLNKSNYSITGSVAFGAFTPLCACGTMAVIIAMLTTALPLGPIMAFLTSSPLMSPDGFIFVAGIIGVKFAIALTLASIIIGYGSGYITHLLEIKTGFLKNQTRVTEKQKEQKSCCENATVPVQTQTCGCSSEKPVLIKIQPATKYSSSNETGINVNVRAIKYNCCTDIDSLKINKRENVMPMCCCPTPEYIQFEQFMNLYRVNEFEITNNMVNKIIELAKKIKWSKIGKEVYGIGVKQILVYYTIFVAVGFLINALVPGYIIIKLFSANNIFAVPLAAIIGLPIYVNGESAIPLIKSLMAGGASGGAMLAFLITGPGTSAGVIAGISTILKKRAIVLYTLYLLVGGIVLGYLYDLLLALGL